MAEFTQLRQMRSVLIAPAVRRDFIAKLPTRGADLLFLDCEDAIPADDESKALARSIARESVPDLVAARCSVLVRCNPVESPWFVEDIAVGIAPQVAAVVVPKVESVAGLDLVSDALDNAGLDSVGIFAGIETALGVLDARVLLSHRRVTGAYFGAEDLVADIGGRRTKTNHEVAYARSSVALAASVGQVPIVDQVVTSISDHDRFSLEGAQALAMGYSGKLCIHPGQVPLANAAFSPNEVEVDNARRLLAAYEEAKEKGIAAINFEGQMVDEPLAVQARRLVDRAAQ